MAPLLAVTTSRLDVWELVLHAGPMAKLVLLVLAGFSIVSWAIIAERLRAFRKAERESEDFVGRFRQGGSLASIHDTTAHFRNSPLASMFRAGFREISLNPPKAGSLDPADVEALDRVLRKSASAELTDLERSLGFLATTASVTPFIGLFGTVWGIMNAFRAIGASGTASLASYAPGIAEALVATAAGLAAAIPAVIGYNHFLRRLRLMDARTDEFIADFVHRVLGRKA